MATDSESKTAETSASKAKLSGTVDHFVYQNEQNQWSVARLSGSFLKPVTITGKLFGVKPGESIELYGKWVNSKEHGRQFEVENYEIIEPSGMVAIRKYLGSGLIPGIGPKMAERIVEKFGEKSLEIIENEPGRLRKVSGIGKNRIQLISEAFKEQKSLREIVIFLNSLDLGPSYAVKIQKYYGEETIEKIKENPYRLSNDIRGIGFKKADQIASRMAVPSNSVIRAEAGLMHILDEAATEGHVCLPKKELLEKATRILHISSGILESALTGLIKNDRFVLERKLGDFETVYTKQNYINETGIAKCIKNFLGHESKKVKIDPLKAVEWLEERESFGFSNEQRDAIKKSFKSKLLLITGGPGTGKTTIIRSIATIFALKKFKIAMAAPTGKAAKRMEESCKKPATTLHRLLKWNQAKFAFEKNEENPIEADLILVDEISMIDNELFYRLLRAVPLNARLILIGDKDQLPSVGAGAIIKNLESALQIEKVTLKTVYRQSSESLIAINAHSINQGKLPESSVSENGDFFFLGREEPDEVLNLIEYLCSTKLPKKYRIDPVRDIQVLTPMQRGVLGAQNLNLRLQSVLNPLARRSKNENPRRFFVGDKVMQMRNNYDLEVFNGDTGIIRDINDDFYLIDFQDSSVEYPRSDLDQLNLSYACTIHKSQGSEFPVVIIPVHCQHFIMLQRNLIYTAVTRARKLVILAGQVKAVNIAVQNDSSKDRFGFLSDRISKALSSI